MKKIKTALQKNLSDFVSGKVLLIAGYFMRHVSNHVFRAFLPALLINQNGGSFLTEKI